MKHTLTLLGLCLAVLCNAQSASTPKQDSIFIDFDEYGQKVITHTIQQDETLYSLSRFYGMSMDQLYANNPSFKQNTWEIGDKLIIPLPNRAIIRYMDQEKPSKDLIPLYYQAKKGDTMYGIAKKQFKMPVEDLLVKNGLKTNTLSLEQILLVGWMRNDGIDSEWRIGNQGPLFYSNQQLGELFEKGKSTNGEIYAHGMAYWDTKGNSSGALYTLHRTAAINSTIAVHNPMNEKTVHVKVIGRIPENVYPDKVMIVISPKAAHLLGALDGQFFVKVRYLH